MRSCFFIRINKRNPVSTTAFLVFNWLISGVKVPQCHTSVTLLYFLNGTGLYSNKQIGELFGLTYSAVSPRANIVKSEIFRQPELRQKYSLIKSMIKV
jgi:hypothetical protein